MLKSFLVRNASWLTILGAIAVLFTYGFLYKEAAGIMLGDREFDEWMGIQASNKTVLWLLTLMVIGGCLTYIGRYLFRSVKPAQKVSGLQKFYTSSYKGLLSFINATSRRRWSTLVTLWTCIQVSIVLPCIVKFMQYFAGDITWQPAIVCVFLCAACVVFSVWLLRKVKRSM